MTARTVVIAGAHGFMGTRFAELYRAEGDRVVTVGRRDADAVWGDTDAITRLVDGADVLVNLAGKSVNCRYNERNKAEIFRSRLETTAELGRAVAAAATPPPVWFNASTATIYRHADDRPQTEEDGELGHGFSVEVAKAWESTFFDAARDGVRQVALRTAITLGDGSALTPLVALTRIGMGGPQLGGPSNRGAGLAGGRQRFSWVHLDDVFRAMRFLEVSRAQRGDQRDVAEPLDEPRGDGDPAPRARGAVRHPASAHRARGGRPRHPHRDRADPQEPVGAAETAARCGFRVPLPGPRGSPPRDPEPACEALTHPAIGGLSACQRRVGVPSLEP